MLGYIAQKLTKLFPLIVLASFVWIAIFGVGMSMNAEEEGNMSGCPFAAGEASLCPMGVAEHIATWQQTITVIPKSYRSIILVLFAVLAISVFSKLLHQPKILPTKLSTQSYRRRELELKAFSPLLAAFSDGILNPKIYEPARI